MVDLNSFDLQAYIILALGLFALLYPLFRKNKDAVLNINGEKTEGIIFDLGIKSGSAIHSNVFDKVTVRFLTKTKEWITADIDQDFANFYTGQYKPGEPVDVYYDKANPYKFFVDTKQSEGKTRLLFVLIGSVFVVVGIYQLLTT